MMRKRVKVGDPEAMLNLGNQYITGDNGLVKNVTRSLELFERAADLGLKNAHYRLSYLYHFGVNVEKDTAKAMRHSEAAAVRGHVLSRHNLGYAEDLAGNYDIALQHYLISANLGYQDSLTCIKIMFTKGLATKADYAEALRGHQKAVTEMKSPDRDEAKALGFTKIMSLHR